MNNKLCQRSGFAFSAVIIFKSVYQLDHHSNISRYTSCKSFRVDILVYKAYQSFHRYELFHKSVLFHAPNTFPTVLYVLSVRIAHKAAADVVYHMFESCTHKMQTHIDKGMQFYRNAPATSSFYLCQSVFRRNCYAPDETFFKAVCFWRLICHVRARGRSRRTRNDTVDKYDEMEKY